MHPGDCNGWEYEKFANARQVVGERSAAILIRLRTGGADTRATSLDTRPSHGEMFKGLTPDACSYYAGNYRGSSHRCLQHYKVKIPADDRVGAAPAMVTWEMQAFCAAVGTGIHALDAADKLPGLSKEEKKANAVALVAHLFEDFLRIHPYANGNGHAGRLMLIAFLGRYGFWARHFHVEPKPPEPTYSEAIAASRDGNREVLEAFIMNRL